MKTSAKIFSAMAVTIITFFVIGLVIVRKDLQYYLFRTEKEKYHTISTDSFERIELSAQWDVRIIQGKYFKVQLLVADTSLRPKLESISGTLYLKTDSISGKTHASTVRARIIAPAIKSIFSKGDTKINIENFDSDSLSVTIEDGCAFTGNGNNFKFVSFKSSGDARIDLTDLSDF